MRRRLNPPSYEQLLTNKITSNNDHLTTLNIVRSPASDEPPVAVSKTAGEQQPVAKLFERGLELTQMSASAFCTQPSSQVIRCSSSEALSSAHEFNNTETTLSQDNSFDQLNGSSSPVTSNQDSHLEDQSSSAEHHDLKSAALGNSHGLQAGD